MNNSFDLKPWYRQLWPWFLILLPASVVLATLFTVYLFNQHQVSLVSEDYYKEGKGINQELSLLKQAAALGISATLTSEADLLVVKLNKGAVVQFMPINIAFQHRTLPEKDIEQMLTADASGRYRMQLKQPLTGPWYIEISSFDQSWRIQAKANFPTSAPIKLIGKKQP